MNNESVWKLQEKEYAPLETDITCDVAVIGGGIAGYLAAYRLAEAGRSVVLLEANRLFSGTTRHTTAKISSNQGNVYADLDKRYGKAVASAYYKSQRDGIRGYLDLIEKYGIDCDLEQVDAYIFTRGDTEPVDEQVRALKSAGADVERTGPQDLMHIVAAVKMSEQYVFDPIKFLTGLPVHFDIYEHTRIVGVRAERKMLITERGNTVKANKIVVATHYPIIKSHGGYHFKLRPSMSYTVAVEGRRVDAAYLDEREDGISLRNYADGTIIGACDHRTGRGDGDEYHVLDGRANELFGAKPTHRWCTQDCMTFDGLPMVGKYAKNLPDFYVVTGFNKWGMTNAMTAASVVTDLICGRPNPYSELFSPQRAMKGTLGAFLSNAVVSVAHILLGAFRIPLRGVDSVPKGKGMIVWYHGRRRAVYRDENDGLHVIDHRCTHMKGELKWNDAAKTWDCPCHGSRFTIDGDIIAEPAVVKEIPRGRDVVATAGKKKPVRDL